MSKHPTTGFDLDEVDRLLTTTKQVRKRLDLTRPVPVDDLLAIIEIANHAPMGGNLERNRWLIVTDAELKARIAERFASVGRPYLAANAELRTDDRGQRVIESAEFLVEHLADVPTLLIALRLDRPPLDPSTQGGAAAYYGSVLPGVWSFQLAAEREGSARRGPPSTSSMRPRSPSSSASHRPSPRSASSPSATTPARPSRPHRDARCERSRTSTVGSKPSASAELHERFRPFIGAEENRAQLLAGGRADHHVVTQHLDVSGQPLERMGSVQGVGPDERDGLTHDV